MDAENAKMRRIISVYIQSADLNDPAWDMMEENDMSGRFLLLFQYCGCWKVPYFCSRVSFAPFTLTCTICRCNQEAQQQSQQDRDR
jgi:hypothetical protein